VDVLLDPEMKSTGEVLGIGKTREEALYKGLVAAGYKMKRRGGLLVTVRDSDKGEIADTVRGFAELGFALYATKGTARVLRAAGMEAAEVDKPRIAGAQHPLAAGKRQDRLHHLHLRQGPAALAGQREDPPKGD
jgi:hypothetical protein